MNPDGSEQVKITEGRLGWRSAERLPGWNEGIGLDPARLTGSTGPRSGPLHDEAADGSDQRRVTEDGREYNTDWARSADALARPRCRNGALEQQHGSSRQHDVTRASASTSADGRRRGERAVAPAFIARGRMEMLEGLSGRRDSNPRPLPWQGNALPTELRPQEVQSVAPNRRHGVSESSPPAPSITAAARTAGAGRSVR